MKVCNKCNQEKELTEFRKSGFTPAGTQKYKQPCKECKATPNKDTGRVTLICDHCKKEFSRIKSKSQSKSGKIFCSKSCMDSAKRYMKEIRPDWYGDTKKPKCLGCGEELKHNRGTYCSNQCQQNYQYKINVAAWLDGSITGHCGKTYVLRRFIRRFLLEESNYCCENCGFSGFHPTDGSSILEIDHIDGDPSNSSCVNLRVLCPNCHSMTETFRNRNNNSCRDRNRPVN